MKNEQTAVFYPKGHRETAEEILTMLLSKWWLVRKFGEIRIALSPGWRTEKITVDREFLSRKRTPGQSMTAKRNHVTVLPAPEGWDEDEN